MKKIIVVIIFIQVFIISRYVAPSPVFRLQSVPNQKETVWLHGKEYSKLSGKNIDIVIAFDEVKQGMISFNVEVLNHGLESIVISSELFKGSFLDANQLELKKNAQQNAIDPEDQLLQIDKAISKEDARYAEESSTKAISLLFDLADDVTSIGNKKTDEEIQKESQDDLDKELQDINDENYHSRSKLNLSNRKGQWTFSALRKTTLPLQYSVSGKIYFPLITKGQYFKIVFDEDKENLDIVFKIESFK